MNVCKCDCRPAGWEEESSSTGRRSYHRHVADMETRTTKGNGDGGGDLNFVSKSEISFGALLISFYLEAGKWYLSLSLALALSLSLKSGNVTITLEKERS
jgi:hypothetical protein